MHGSVPFLLVKIILFCFFFSLGAHPSLWIHLFLGNPHSRLNQDFEKNNEDFCPFYSWAAWLPEFDERPFVPFVAFLLDNRSVILNHGVVRGSVLSCENKPTEEEWRHGQKRGSPGKVENFGKTAGRDQRSAVGP
jgi:hypothetical protein